MGERERMLEGESDTNEDRRAELFLLKTRLFKGNGKTLDFLNKQLTRSSYVL